jgi:hypothetical protein
LAFVESLTGARWVAAARALSVALHALTVATGLFGVRNVYQNFSMTFFWIVFGSGSRTWWRWWATSRGDQPWRVLSNGSRR